jgi:hypothetical protein
MVGWLVGWLSLDGLTSLSLGVTVLLLEGKILELLET